MAANAPQQPRRGRQTAVPAPATGIYIPRVVLKFHDFISLPYEDGVEKYFDALSIGPWAALLADFPGITVNRLFVTLSPNQIQDLVAAAVARDPTYTPPNFLTYFSVDCQGSTDRAALAIRLAAWPSVQLAYVEGIPGKGPQVNPTDDTRTAAGLQGYVDPAPGGIDARCAWAIPGAAGDNIGFVDQEHGWRLNHEDLAAAGIGLISGLNYTNFDHGTNSLGVVVAVDNDRGDVGIATHANARVISEWRPTWNRPDTITAALAAMNYGDVLLLEVAYSTAACDSCLPAEVEDAVYQPIRMGTALGIVIVEPAGNGGVDLDTAGPGGTPLLPNDSGAILVGAAEALVHQRMVFSCFGSRVNCFAWGEAVDTPRSTAALNNYTNSFGGTSSASAIVAGAALVVQSAALRYLLFRLSPGLVRVILSSTIPGVNTPSVPANALIGVMPDLCQILQNVLGITPDVYAREFACDMGDPRTGPTSASPDLIGLAVPVGGPQAAFGEGSGTENSSTLGDPVVAGKDHTFYVRVRNRGGAETKDVTATLYRSPLCTLLTPDLWNLVGSVTIPNVPSGDVLTVSDAITWPAAAIPASGDYSLICLVGNADDPAPPLAEFFDFDSFRRIMRRNNNVARRSFALIPLAAALDLPFLVAGAPDESAYMQLEVGARLPHGSQLWLDAPATLVDVLDEASPFVQVKGTRAWIPLFPYGRRTLKRFLFGAGLRLDLRLHVEIPAALLDHPHELYVRQLFEEEEVGRVTWRLV